MKIKFLLNNPKDDFYFIRFFLNDKNIYWRNRIFKRHPKLKSIDKVELMGYIKEYYDKHKDFLEKAVNNFQLEWDKLNDSFINALSEVTETRIPNRIVKAFVSINPICPRNISNWFFNIFYKQNKVDMIKTISHELTHFFYFKKWSEVFDDNPNTYESPHLNWALSELLVSVILNDSRIKAITKVNARSYDYFYKRKINGKSLVKHFSNIYADKKSFNDFLKSVKLEARKFSKLIKE